MSHRPCHLFHRLPRWFRFIALLAGSAGVPPAAAVVSIDGTRRNPSIEASASLTDDSNVFMDDSRRRDVVRGASLSAEYTRRSGWLGLDAGLAVESSRFSSLRGQDFDNPSFHLDLLKRSGRTTGFLSLAAARESRADALVNTRSTYWSFPAGFGVRYPVGGALALGSAVNHSARRYVDDVAFANLHTWSVSLDAIRIIDGTREIQVRYRHRRSETSRGTVSLDRAVSSGMSGRLVRGLQGDVHAGVQTRHATGRGEHDGAFASWFAGGSATYEISRRLRLTGSLAKDFTTTATDAMVDAADLAVTADYKATAGVSLTSSIRGGASRHLGRATIASGAGAEQGRRDRFSGVDLTLSWAIAEHWRAAVTSGRFRNISTLGSADFSRSTWSGRISFRW